MCTRGATKGARGALGGRKRERYLEPHFGTVNPNLSKNL